MNQRIIFFLFVLSYLTFPLFSNAQTSCDIVVNSYMETCEGENITGPSAPGYTITWDCGVVYHTGADFSLPTSSWAAGEYTCQVTITNGICLQEESITVNVIPSPDIIIEDVTVCENDEFAYLVVSNPDPSLQYSWEGPAIEYSEGAEATIKTSYLFPVLYGDGPYQYTVTATDGVCVQQEEVQLTVFDYGASECPPYGLNVNLNPQEAFAGPLTYYMNGTVSGGEGPYEFVWELPFGTMTSSTANPIYSMPGEDVYEICVTVTDANGGIGSNCTILITPNAPCYSSLLTEQLVICQDIVDPVCGCDGITYSNGCYAYREGITSWTPGSCITECPPLEIGVESNCPGDDLILHIFGPSDISYSWTFYSSSGSVSGTGNPINLTGTPIAASTVVNGTITSYGPSCESTQTFEFIQDNETFSLTTTDQVICEGTISFATLEATSDEPILQYTWNGPGLILSPNSASMVVDISELSPGVHVYTVTATNGYCEVQETATLTIQPTGSPDCPECSAPGNIEVEVLNNTSSEVTWDAMPYAEKYWVKYKYRISPGVFSPWIEQVTNYNSIILDELLYGKHYRIRVKSLCQDGWTDLSPTHSFTQQDCPAVAPEDILLTQNPAGYAFEYHLNWPDVPGATKYEIRFRKDGASTWNTASRVASQMGLSAPIIEHFETYELQIRAKCSSDGYWGPYSHPALLTFDYSDPNTLRQREIPNAKLYPNPAQEHISIAFEMDETADAEYIIQDILGRVVLQGRFVKLQQGFNSTNINISTLDDGQHFIIGRTDKKILFTEKFTKTRQ